MSPFRRNEPSYEFPDLTDLHEVTYPGGGGPSIQCEEFWSNLHKLQWLARWAEVECGWPQGTLRVVKSHSTRNGKLVDDAYGLNYPGGCLGSPGFVGMWDYLSGISLGVRIADRLTQPPTDGPTISITAYEQSS